MQISFFKRIRLLRITNQVQAWRNLYNFKDLYDEKKDNLKSFDLGLY